MTTSFIQKERQRIFRDLTRQYQQEGYATREAKRIAKRETDDIMADKETFVENFVQDTWGEIDE
jgi:hypothetical protein|tara:strand:- start:306 stop:497 length:192 start_codon:yes stop_codon:yes gene_type:complete